MSNAVFENDFSKMDHKQLCEKVEELYGIVAKFQRLYNWQMENIDSSNLGKSLNNTIAKTDGAIKKMSSIEQTADEIKLTVKRLNGEVEESKSEISQTAEQISLGVTQNFDAYYGSATTDGSDRTKLWHKSDGYYYYNTISNRWKKVEDDKIMSSIVLTANGVHINGDMLVDGTITGVDFQTTPSGTYGNNIEIKNADGGIRWYEGNTAIGLIRAWPETKNGVTQNHYVIQATNGSHYTTSIDFIAPTVDFSGVNAIEWGNNKPEAVFG